MKNFLLITLLPFSFLFFKNDSVDNIKEDAFESNSPCRIENVYLNDTLYEEYNLVQDLEIEKTIMFFNEG